MSMLSRVTRGKLKRPHAIIVYGPDGVGKTTFGAEAPAPIFLGPELGSANMDVARFPTPRNWAEVHEATDELIKSNHTYQSLVIDSLDWLEPVLHNQICVEDNAKSIERAAGGYGKGYKEAVNFWINWKDKLEILRDRKKMNLIFLAHCEVIPFNDPQTQSTYDRFQLKLHKLASAFFREYVDAVLFLSYEISVKEEKNKPSRAYGEGQRIAWTERRPGFDAKNRLDLPLQIPFMRGESWKSFADAAEKGEPEKPAAVLSRIEQMLPDVKDDELRAKVLETLGKAAGHAISLLKIEARLKARLAEQMPEEERMAVQAAAPKLEEVAPL